jgi:uncharacterized protein YndB with AHSA1/START domain
MFKKILIGLVLIVAIFAVVIALQPNDFKVTRSIAINAPPSTVFPLVNDFHQWAKWSPWEDKDPAMKRTFAGPESGKDSIYSWVGNDEVGEGSMTITESQPPELVLIKLQFKKPMESEAKTEIAFKPQDQGTAVTWTMTGTNNFIGKAFCLFMNMDKMVGGDFEKGLAKLKAEAEGTAKQ